jgi:hypothetical protein
MKLIKFKVMSFKKFIHTNEGIDQLLFKIRDQLYKHVPVEVRNKLYKQVYDQVYDQVSNRLLNNMRMQVRNLKYVKKIYDVSGKKTDIT